MIHCPNIFNRQRIIIFGDFGPLNLSWNKSYIYVQIKELEELANCDVPVLSCVYALVIFSLTSMPLFNKPLEFALLFWVLVL